MTKGQLKNGTKMFIVRIEHYVKLHDFSEHIAEHFYNKNEQFNELITKKEAEEILKRGLFFYGLNGQYEHGYFEASFEEGEKFNNIYNSAYEWVKSHYPHLSF